MADTPAALAGSPLRIDRRIAGTLVLVRHGESTWVAEGRFQGRQDPPLSELGIRQAKLVADRLAQRDDHTPLPIPKGAPIGIWHSPLQRAADTALEVAAQLSHEDGSPVDISLSPGLTEIAQGDWEGRPHTEVKSRWAHELAAWRRTPAQAHAPGGEPLVKAAGRVGNALAEIVSALAVASPGYDAAPSSDEAGDLASLRYDPVPGYPSSRAGSDLPPEPWAVVVAHDGIFRLALMNLLGVPLERFWSFPFNLASITVVSIHEGVAALRAHNLSDHLEPVAVAERAAQESRGERRGAL
ncbi:MAG: histidine phosphatase family protein [Candidatus Limnocylindrales bacterium]